MDREIEKYLFKKFIYLFFKGIKKRWITFSILTFLLTVILVYFSELAKKDNSEFLRLSAETWIAIASSMFAATIFSIIQFMSENANGSEKNMYAEELKKFYSEGLLEILPQRGSEHATKLYAEAVHDARNTIWAIGMTNSKMISEHMDFIIKSLEQYDTLDVVIAFWNPKCKIVNPGAKTNERGLSEIQFMLEERAICPTNIQDIILERQKNIIERINKHTKLQGRIRIVNLSLVTNFTSFVIDSRVFFFPFLSQKNSSVMPTILCTTMKGMGKAVYEHIHFLLNDEIIKNEVREVVFDRKGNEILINLFSSS